MSEKEENLLNEEAENASNAVEASDTEEKKQWQKN